MIAQKKNKQNQWVYEEYLKIEDENRYEILNGELIMAPAPSSKHQTVSKKVEFKLYLLEEKGIGHVFDAPLDVVLNEDVVVQPDLIFILEKNKDIIQEKGIIGVPDVIIEIISKSSAQIDREKKYHIYKNSGVKEYWIIDPLWYTIEVFVLKDNNYQLHCSVQEEGLAKSAIIPDFELDINEII